MEAIGSKLIFMTLFSFWDGEIGENTKRSYEETMAVLDDMEKKEVEKWLAQFKNDVERCMNYPLIVRNAEEKLEENFPDEVIQLILMNEDSLS